MADRETERPESSCKEWPGIHSVPDHRLDRNPAPHLNILITMARERAGMEPFSAVISWGAINIFKQTMPLGGDKPPRG